jgi:hypothetical protein
LDWDGDWARAQCELVVYRAYNILPGHSLVFVAAQCDDKATSSTVRPPTGFRDRGVLQ